MGIFDFFKKEKKKEFSEKMKAETTFVREDDALLMISLTGCFPCSCCGMKRIS